MLPACASTTNLRVRCQSLLEAGSRQQPAPTRAIDGERLAAIFPQAPFSDEARTGWQPVLRGYERSEIFMRVIDECWVVDGLDRFANQLHVEETVVAAGNQ